MNKKVEKELLANFRGMTPENKKHFLAYSSIALATQENTRRELAKEAKAKKTA